jgi:hypothetical protein
MAIEDLIRTSTTSPPNGDSDSEGQAEGWCEVCNSAGWIVYDVWPGDPRFGQPFPCPACGPQRKAAQQRRRIAGAVAQLDNELGRLRRCTFDNFDLERPLGSATWGGRIFSVEEQRDMLATALRVCKEYASVRVPAFFEGNFTLRNES